MSAKKGNPFVRGDQGRGERQGDRSDVRQEFARLKAQSGFEPQEIADGRQPFMPLRVSHDPCLQNLSLPFRSSEADGPLSVGRIEGAFHPTMAHYGDTSLFCKEFSAKTFLRRLASALIALAPG
jgi:hypothetical protein